MLNTGVAATHVEPYVDALRHANRAEAARVVNDALAAGATGLEVLDDLITPAMYEIGRLWECGEIGIADEHLATVISHQSLPLIYPHLTGTARTGELRVLLAGTDGEQHTLGLRMIADVLEARGYDVRNAGPSVPVDALLKAIRRYTPRVVGLSNTMPMFTENLRAAVAAVRAAVPEVTVFVGGGAVRDVDFADDGVVVCPTAVAAVSLLEHLI